MTEGNQRMLEGPMKYYGPAFEMGLLASERALGLTDTRTIYFMRHLITFLTFSLATFFFYKLCRYMFGSWKIGLLGALLLVVSPRMLAEAFYNPKDMPFMSLFAISMYTLVRYVDTKTIRWAVAHAIPCAVLVDIRIVGLLLPVFTIALAGLGLVGARREAGLTNRLASLAVFVAVASGLVVLLWPTLWHRPIYHLAQAFKEMSHYPMGNPILYRGHYVRPQEIPWHYIVVWIAISTPWVHLAGFVLGCLLCLRLLLAHSIGG
ncbi:MAG TPA: glycosyltransferase family 39 protein, partial [bacterium]|nr:glycosyltransferase family 39 protein [bacterium]